MDNSKHCDGSKPPILERISSYWKTVVVEQVLGLKSIPDATKKHTQDQSDDEDESAFELLRVCIFRSNTRPVRLTAARFATASPPATPSAATETSTSKSALGSSATPRKDGRFSAACQWRRAGPFTRLHHVCHLTALFRKHWRQADVKTMVRLCVCVLWRSATCDGSASRWLRFKCSSR